MSVDIASIKDRLVTLAESATTASDYKTVAEALKALADYEKASTDAANQAKLVRYEFIKSFSTGIVPFLTLLTLAITIYFQWSQAKITSRANEDAQWRTVVETMTKDPRPTTNALVLTGLIPFYDSDRYRDQAFEIVFLLTRQLAHATFFETLFNTAFRSASWENAKDVMRLSKMLNSSFADADKHFEALGGADALAERANMKSRKPPDDLDKADHQRNEIVQEMTFLGNQVGHLLRQKRPSALPVSDFSGFRFIEADLSNTDLTGLNLSSAEFTRVTLDGATLAPEKFDDAYWNGTKWWNAAKISGPLLIHLIANAAPYGRTDEYYLPEGPDGPRIGRADYVKALEKLCAKADVSCDLEHTPFGGVDWKTREKLRTHRESAAAQAPVATEREKKAEELSTSKRPLSGFITGSVVKISIDEDIIVVKSKKGPDAYEIKGVKWTGYKDEKEVSVGDLVAVKYILLGSKKIAKEVTALSRLNR